MEDTTQPGAEALDLDKLNAWRENVAAQCCATATSDIAANVIVDAGRGTLRELLLCASAALIATPTHAVGAPSDYTVDDSELARKIMVFLGRATSGSMEPGADPLRDRLAERLALWRPAAQPVEAAGAVQDDWKVFKDGMRVATGALFDVVLKNGVTEYARPVQLVDWTQVADWRYAATPPASQACGEPIAIPVTRPLHAAERAADEPLDASHRYFFRVGFNACRNSLATPPATTAAPREGKPERSDKPADVRDADRYRWLCEHGHEHMSEALIEQLEAASAEGGPVAKALIDASIDAEIERLDRANQPTPSGKALPAQEGGK